MLPFATPVVSQFGNWLCHSSVWPRTREWFASANATRLSAPDQSKTPCSGSTTCHFISLPGVYTENWLAAMAAHAGVLRSSGIIALPMCMPILAPSARREVGSILGSELIVSASPVLDGAAQAAEPELSNAAAPPAAPIARRLRRLIDFLLSAERFRFFAKVSETNLSDSRNLKVHNKPCQ